MYARMEKLMKWKFNLNNLWNFMHFWEMTVDKSERKECLRALGVSSYIFFRELSKYSCCKNMSLSWTGNVGSVTLFWLRKSSTIQSETVQSIWTMMESDCVNCEFNLNFRIEIPISDEIHWQLFIIDPKPHMVQIQRKNQKSCEHFCQSF